MKLIINNSMSYVIGLDSKTHSSLSSLLCQEPTDYVKFVVGGRFGFKTLLTKKGEFPTGLLQKVISFLKKENLTFDVVDKRIKPNKNINLTANYLNPLYDFQIDASNACLKNERGIISCPTGAGKSFIIAKIIESLKVPTLVVVPNLALKRQLTKTLSEIFGAENVCNLKNISIQNIDSISTRDIIKNYDCVIIDEFHHAASKTYRKLNKKAFQSIYYRFGLTATPWRTQDNEQILLESVLSDLIYKISYRECVEKKYITQVESFFVDLPKVKSKANSYPSAYSELVVNRKDRNETIANMLKSLDQAGKYTLCLVKEISHGKTLQDLTGFDFVKGENEDNEDKLNAFNSGSLKTLIATVGVMGEGCDTKPCEYVVIAGLGKARSAFMQQVGRAVRKYPEKDTAKVILFRDTSNKYTVRHFKEQCKILSEEYGSVPALLD